MDLTPQDTQNLLLAIEELYSLHDLSSFGIRVLSIVNQLVPSDVPSFHIVNMRSRQISHIVLPGYPGFTPEMEQVSHRRREHPITQNLPHTLNGAHKISDFITQAEFHQLEGLYQQVMRLIDCEDQMTIFLLNSASNSQHQDGNELLQENDTLATICLNRTQRNFTERDRLILNLLRPHLFQAYSNAQHHHQLQQNLAQLHQSLDSIGLIILDGIGRIQLITSQATEWLQTYFVKSTQSDRLPELLWAWVRHQISSANNHHLSQACLPLRIEQANQQLVIRLIVKQIGERYLLLLEEQTLSLLSSLQMLGLSQRETEVLFWVIRGKDNQAIAKHLNIYISTVRKHLESIYRKLGVQSRTEAIAQALEKLGHYSCR